jgi:hypothetical protein
MMGKKTTKIFSSIESLNKINPENVFHVICIILLFVFEVASHLYTITTIVLDYMLSHEV